MEYYRKESDFKLKIDTGICPERLLKLKSLQEQAQYMTIPQL
jgi:hypothetical protein